MNQKRNVVFLLLVLATLVSCDNDATYKKTYAFKNKEWQQKVKPSFVFEVKDSTKVYDFALTIRTTADYKFSNLWLYWNTTTPQGEKAREPFEIKIADPEGRWVGKKTGTLVENTLYFKRRKMPTNGKYVFTLEQGITNTSLDQLLDVTLSIDEVK